MVEKSVENIGRFMRGGRDDARMVGRVLVGDVGVEADADEGQIGDVLGGEVLAVPRHADQADLGPAAEQRHHQALHPPMFSDAVQGLHAGGQHRTLAAKIAPGESFGVRRQGVDHGVALH